MINLRLKTLGVLGYGMELLDTPHNRGCARWLKENNQYPVLNLEYEGLGPESRLVDVGGWLGNWTAHWQSRTGGRVEVYEPVPRFADRLRTRFGSNSRITVHGYGLGAYPRRCWMEVEGGSSSHVAALNTRGQEQVYINDVVRSMSVFEEIGLMGMNVEGAEFEILPALIKSGMIGKIRHIQIQFHQFIPKSREMRDRITRGLEKTHRKTYDWPWVWESWTRSDGL